MSNFRDISTGPHDTYAQLSAQQREQLRQHRIQEAKDAFKLINRVASRDEWPEDELKDVLGMLGISSEPGTDRDWYAGPMIPIPEPGPW